MDESAFYGLFLIVYIVIAAFTVLNMLIGVVCQIVAQTSQAERTQSQRQLVESLFRLLEIDDTGFISRKELERNKHVLSELEKNGVDEETIRVAIKITDRKTQAELDDGSHLDLEDFLEVIFKLLNRPQTQDILLVQKKLEKLEKALSSTAHGDSEASRKQVDLLDVVDEPLEMDEATRMAVEKSLWNLESQVASMLDHAMEKVAKPAKQQPTAGWDVELRRLDAAMCRLRVRLERCQNEVGRAEAHTGGEAADEALNVASAEHEYWRQLCGEVVQSISAASSLMNQAVREAEPDGMFKGTAEKLYSAGVVPRTDARI
jgi:hypothetical protein